MSLAFLNPCRKRAREDDEDEFEVCPQAKKPYHCSLPFRTSPTIQHCRLFSQTKRNKPKPLFTQTVTPNDSDDEISPCSRTEPVQSHGDGAAPPMDDEMQDMVMDMCEDTMLPSPRSIDQAPTPPNEEYLDTNMLSPGAFFSPKPSPRTLLDPEADAMIINDVNNTGRIPTPIYGHFQIQPQTHTPPETALPLLTTSFATAKSQFHSDADIEYEQYLRSRRLPSPISEDEAMDFPARPSAITTPADNLPYTPSTTPNSESGRDRFHKEHISPMRLRTPARMAQPLMGKSSGGPQHGKIMFSMGFRADCEMCRNRVPGHSNHIFRV